MIEEVQGAPHLPQDPHNLGAPLQVGTQSRGEQGLQVRLGHGGFG